MKGHAGEKRRRRKVIFRRTTWSLLLDFVIGWVAALLLLLFLRSYGLVDARPVVVSTAKEVVMMIVFGAVAGLLFGFIHLRSERYYQRRFPLGKLLLVFLLIQSMVVLLISGLIYRAYGRWFGLRSFTFWQFIQTPSFTVFFVYALLTNSFLITLRQVNLLLGPGNLMRFVRGEFYHPHEEVMIFMFLDLQSSTALAEQLGHIRYSQLIQDCFSDLSLVTDFKASIYQYVGDEAVLTWKQVEGLDNHNCLRAFFAFEDRLLQRADVYQRRYGTVPVFKAGVNIGQVTVAEVGVVKREIAFHGDTVNTAARIQGQCNTYDKRLLISEFLQQKLMNTQEFHQERIGAISLRGKREALDLYAVERSVV